MKKPGALLIGPQLSGRALAEVLRLLGEIDEFKGHWRKLQEMSRERLMQLRQVATIESSGSSTRIEGAELTDVEVSRVLAGLAADAFRERDASEVRGYGDLLETIYESHASIPLEERYVKQLHGILLGQSERDEWHRGRYKTSDNHVEARYPDGRVEVLFRTASPFETPARMESLIERSSTALESGDEHPLIVIAWFVVEFLAIHPFQDGNGRLARALTTLLLLRAGYDYVPYASLERVVEENRAGYYAALRESQRAMQDDPSGYRPWLLFFLRALRAQQRNLMTKLEVERSARVLTDTQQRVLQVVTDHGRVTSTLVAEALGMPARTVRYNLNVLVEEGLVAAEGERRGRTYRRS